MSLLDTNLMASVFVVVIVLVSFSLGYTAMGLIISFFKLLKRHK